MKKIHIKLIRLNRKFWGIMSVSDYRKYLKQRYKNNPELEFTDNY